MKKMFMCGVMLCMALTLFCATAAAGELSPQITPVNANAVDVTQKDTGGDGLAFTVKKTSGATDGQLFIVMIQQVEQGANVTDKPKPTSDNLYYVNVGAATGPTFSMDAYPRDGMPEGKYVVYLSDYSESSKGAAQGVATILLGDTPAPTPYTLGDVDGKDGIVPVDALLALQIAAKTLSNVEDWQIKAADVDKKDGVTPVDALLILQKAADPTGFDFSKYQ